MSNVATASEAAETQVSQFLAAIHQLTHPLHFLLLKCWLFNCDLSRERHALCSTNLQLGELGN